MIQQILTLYTRTPLHVGCGTSVDVIDLPITRERITNFPVIPSSGLKGVLRDAGRHATKIDETSKLSIPVLDTTKLRLLFGEDRKLNSDATKGDLIEAHAGCVQIIEAKLLAFPVRSLKGCFAWLTCPSALHRFQRDTGRSFTIPVVSAGQSIAGSEITDGHHVFLEEYSLKSVGGDLTFIVQAMKSLCDDPLWLDKLDVRLALISDEDFQHFVTTCTEVVQRIVINPATRTNTNLFSQENVPCETLFYSVLTLLPTRQVQAADLSTDLTALLTASPVLQIGGDETTGHGFCTVKPIPLT
jgi:CRISPR-associated protein Cmr4